MLNIQDLTNDKILLHTKRMEFDGKTVPSLGGIPLLRKIGQGGMGAVYVGYRQLLQREVAVKVLPQQVAAQDEQMTERFLRKHGSRRRSHRNISSPSKTSAKRTASRTSSWNT